MFITITFKGFEEKVLEKKATINESPKKWVFARKSCGNSGNALFFKIMYKNVLKWDAGYHNTK